MIVYGKERDYIIWDEHNIKGLFHEYKFLSNFEECEVHYDGLIYSSTEAAYQSAKVLDMDIRNAFTKMKPKDAMNIGRAFEKNRSFQKGLV